LVAATGGNDKTSIEIYLLIIKRIIFVFLQHNNNKNIFWCGVYI
jgi:hypothetical protein